MRRSFLLFFALLLTAPAATVIEAEDYRARGAEGFRDKRASGGRCAGVIFEKGRNILAAQVELPPGDYEAVFWLEVTPIEVLHHLAVNLSANKASIKLNQTHFDRRPGYRPFPLRFLHPGGVANIKLAGSGGSGFDGMRQALSKQEIGGLRTLQVNSELLDDKGEKEDDDELDDDPLAGLEEANTLQSLAVYQHRLVCDRVVITPLRLAGALVAGVEVDKVHYAPGETVRANATLLAADATGAFRLVAEDIGELDERREVYATDIQLAAGKRQNVSFEFTLTDREFGRELRCTLRRDGKEVHSGGAFFGVSRNVYRVGITAAPGPQDTRRLTAKQGRNIMARSKRNYGNYFERFAWAPCDYSNLAPTTEIFFSGQTQYPGSRTGMRNLISEAHKVGIKAITYGKACAAGIHGFNTYQRHPEFFWQRPEGLPSEAYHVFYLERMLANDYLIHAKPIDGGWQHWASMWMNKLHDGTVDFGADALIASAKMFGWDGVRWDGHFVGNQQRCVDRLNAAIPNYVHGYNIAFANPAGKIFLPRTGREEDFHTVAANHGLMMDESVRNWSHTNFSSGRIRPFYEAICREADYIKRIGGLPLFITFDMASAQDRTLNVLFGLAAGERYTYMNSPGDFPYGKLPKFLTRYSAFVWDDTKRVADVAAHVRVDVGAAGKEAMPFFDHSVWLRQRPEGRQQLLVNLVGKPGYSQFCNRVQPPSPILEQVAVWVKTPPQARLTRAVQISPDLTAGHLALTPAKDGEGQRVVLPGLRAWSIVMLEYEGAATPAFPLTTPVEDASEHLAKEAAKKAPAPAEPAKPKPPPFYKDYARSYNIDLENEKKMKKPASLALRRNGKLDVHHARGPFSWLNPVESAFGILGGNSFRASWVDRVGFRLRNRGCMDEFPDRYDDLLAYDVLAVDNIHARELGYQRRVMIADFVRQGGGLLFFGGFNTLSLGGGHNTYLAELIPIRIRQFKEVLRRDEGLALAVAKPEFFGERIDWTKPAHAFMVDTSPLKEGVEVLLTAGGKPAIVAHRYGKGRVVTVLMNQHGDYPAGVTPYWEWGQWPKVLAACVQWLGEGYKEQIDPKTHALAMDPNIIKPDELMLEAMLLEGAQFTKKLQRARRNMVDAESARLLLQTAVDNAEKIEDEALLPDIVNRARPYFDRSFAKLGEHLAKANESFLRVAAYRILGLAGDPQHRPLLEAALRDENRDIVRDALSGLGNLRDPAASPAVRRYRRRGSEKLLALAVLKRLGDETILKEALLAYEHGLLRRIRLKSGRRSIHDTLYGGVAFKLTRAQRKAAMADYQNIKKVERQAVSDLRYFRDSLQTIGDGDMTVMADFFAATTTPEMQALAYTVLGRMPAATAAKFRARMATAKLKGLRLVADG